MSHPRTSSPSRCPGHPPSPIIVTIAVPSCGESSCPSSISKGPYPPLSFSPPPSTTLPALHPWALSSPSPIFHSPPPFPFPMMQTYRGENTCTTNNTEVSDLPISVVSPPTPFFQQPLDTPSSTPRLPVKNRKRRSFFIAGAKRSCRINKVMIGNHDGTPINASDFFPPLITSPNPAPTLTFLPSAPQYPVKDRILPVHFVAN
mmetsp:Transcript_27084/g.67956  ORF Transcript_27084/g.67956 Transcript_27084/m.67956 type:complete len:203 (-) Transcript_27084:708-1316(-)|eukprot:CAMPEP_0174899236 /NCGR_PEP_ID=MMETSP0167-20121228/25979_1 /TAXON_ID=38298 /ORGANISM="Rhodella maculata, Strain CCMP736" /LENGTH=202 /DNA_ID=CAMNT_0016140155 /DNA_START=229 /DNA_END=837 /DNA_ORIENTATION=+